MSQLHPHPLSAAEPPDDVASRQLPSKGNALAPKRHDQTTPDESVYCSPLSASFFMSRCCQLSGRESGTAAAAKPWVAPR